MAAPCSCQEGGRGCTRQFWSYINDITKLFLSSSCFYSMRMWNTLFPIFNGDVLHVTGATVSFINTIFGVLHGCSYIYWTVDLVLDVETATRIRSSVFKPVMVDLCVSAYFISWHDHWLLVIWSFMEGGNGVVQIILCSWTWDEKSMKLDSKWHLGQGQARHLRPVTKEIKCL